jgi:hypothetical protein
MGGAGAAGGAGGTGAAGGMDSGKPSSDAGRPWRETREPFCDRATGRVDSLDVWSDTRGVFVLMGRAGRERIWSNPGQGWTILQEAAADGDGRRLSGFDNGPLVKYGLFGCGVHFVEAGQQSCTIALSEVGGFFPVRRDRAYATHYDQVLAYDGEYWQQLGSPLSSPTAVYAKQLWANDTALLVATNQGVFAGSSSTRALEPDPNLPRAGYESVWQTPAGTRFAGASRGELWRRGAGTWGLAWEETCERSPTRLWGSGETVFFATQRTFGMHDPAGASAIEQWPCSGSVRIAGLWGNAPDEVFIALIDESLQNSECGEALLLWYDGANLHRL